MNWLPEELALLSRHADTPAKAMEEVNRIRVRRKLKLRTIGAVEHKLRRMVGTSSIVVGPIPDPKLVLKIPDYKGLVVKPRLERTRHADEDGFFTISDTHIGVLNDRGESNAPAIREKLMTAANNVLHVLRNHNRVNNLHICLLGDIVTGQENYQYQMTEVAPITLQTKEAVEILYEVLVYLLDGLHGLGIHPEILAVAGNHGKTSPFRNPESDNVDMLVYEMVKKCLSPRYPWLVFRMDVRRLITQIQGLTICLEHGDKVRSYVNVPWQSWERRSNRLQGVENIIFNIYMIGHHHGFGIWQINRTTLLMSGTMQTDSDLGDSIGLLPVEKYWLFSLSHGRLGFQYHIDLRDQRRVDVG